MDKKKKIIFTIESLLVLLFLLFIGSGVVVSPFFGEINMIDEGQIGAWVRHMLNGEFLYKDIYAAYGSFYIYPSFLLAKVFGPSVFIIRIVYIVLNTFLAILIARLVLTKMGISYIFVTLTLVVLLIIPGLGMRQGMGLLAILLGYLAFEKKRLMLCAITGIALSFSYLFSSEIGIFVTAIFIILFAYQLITAKQVRTIVKKIITIIVCACLTFLIFYIWADSEGWFWSYVNSILSDMTIYSGVALPNGKSFPNALDLFPKNISLLASVKYIVSKELLLYWLFFLYLVSSLYLVVRLIIGQAVKKDLLVFLIVLYGLCLSTILIGRYGHFSFTLVPAFILLAYFSDTLLRQYKSTSSFSQKAVSVVGIFLICLFLLRIVLIYRPHFTKIFLIPHAIMSVESNPEYIGAIQIPPSQKEEILIMQKFIAENTVKSDNVFFLNNEPMMYLLVDRGNPTRYDIPVVANTKAKRLEVLNDIIKDQTKYVVYNRNAWSVDGVSNFRRIPELAIYLQKNYEKRSLGSFIIYSRKEN